MRAVDGKFPENQLVAHKQLRLLCDALHLMEQQPKAFVAAVVKRQGVIAATGVVRVPKRFAKGSSFGATCADACITGHRMFVDAATKGDRSWTAAARKFEKLVAQAQKAPRTHRGATLKSAGATAITKLFAEGRAMPWMPQLVASAHHGNGTAEIVFPSQHDTAPGSLASARIFVYRFDGTPMPGWPQQINLGYPDGTGSFQDAATHAALGDLDADGKLELVIGLGTSPLSRLHAFRFDGSTVAGWPIVSSDGYTPQPVLGDVDGDGKLEVVAARASGVLGVWRANGVVMAGWPKTVPGPINGPPSLGDFDGDGTLGIIVSTTGDQVFAYKCLMADVTGDGKPEVLQGSGDEGLIYAWQRSGASAPGWPKTLAHPVDLAPAVADLDNDGQLDLAVATLDTLMVLGLGVAPKALDWPSSWHDPAHTGRHVTPVLRGDLNADGVVNTADQQLMVEVLLGTQTGPAIVARGDLNSDGKTNSVDLQLLVNLLLGI